MENVIFYAVQDSADISHMHEKSLKTKFQTWFSGILSSNLGIGKSCHHLRPSTTTQDHP